MANDSIGEEVEKMVADLPEGGVLLLENVRFYKEEEKNDPEFAKKLAALADVYVNDAFGTAHRAHASTEGVAKYLKPYVVGFLMQKVLVSSALICMWLEHACPFLIEHFVLNLTAGHWSVPIHITHKKLIVQAVHPFVHFDAECSLLLLI